MYEVERYERDGLTAVVEVDEFPPDPREWDNLGVMFCWHPDYQLGDEQFDRGLSWTCRRCGGDGEVRAEGPVERDQDEPPYVECPKCEGAGEEEARDLSDVERFLREERGATVILPLVLLDHSGITIRVGSSFTADPGGWDTTRVGFIYATPESIETMGTPADRVEEALRTEVETYDAYLTGDVLAWRVEDEDGDVLEGCGGYYGDPDGAMAEAQAALAVEVARREREAAEEAVEAAKWARLGVPTVAGCGR